MPVLYLFFQFKDLFYVIKKPFIDLGNFMNLINVHSHTHAVDNRPYMEEIGCKAKVVSELGQIVEYRNRWKLKQTSMGYITAQHGKQTSQSLEQSEIDEGHEIVMANDVEDAITILESDAPKNYEGKFIVKRDIAFLVAARDAQNNV